MHEGEMKPTMHGKHRGILTNGVVLHHENARIHMAAVTSETIQKLKFELLPHPAYILLAPSDYQIFRPSKFVNNEGFKDSVHT
jgi:hypothetical protein